LRYYAPLDYESYKALGEDFDSERQYIRFESHKDLMDVLRYVRNGKFGVVYMIDEIHNYFHSHDSKSMPMWVVQVFSQQRKPHLVILGTVQDWEDVIKAIRRQIDNLIMCARSWGYLIHQVVIDPRSAENNYGDVEYSIKRKGFFWISDNVRNAYDTHQVINSGREILGGNDLNIGIKSEGEKSGAKRPAWRRGR